jgi:ubiquinone/menaquinone biosynthesis C-methylase UbiE
MNDPWSSGNAYERFMGRWSFQVAQIFLKWLAVPHEMTWLDVGCGTGTLTKLILETQKPVKIISIDSSKEFISYAKKILNNPSVQFKVCMAESLDTEPGSIDVVVSGLVLNFIPQPEVAIHEMIRVSKPGGKIGIFLWDYSEGMQMLRYFWDAAVELDGKAKEFDEGIRFPLCRKGELKELFLKAGLKDVEEIPIEIYTYFKDFNDYWTPFLGNVGPAPAYAMSLDSQNRKRLETKVRNSLPVNKDGSISIMARVWAVKGTV